MPVPLNSRLLKRCQLKFYRLHTTVIPAKAGIHPKAIIVIVMDSRIRGNDEI